MAKSSRRTKRVAELIREELSRMLLEDTRDPRIGFVTITRVEVTADLASAKVYVSIMGDEARARTAMRGLRSAAGRLRGLLGGRIDLRVVPELQFVEDQGVKHSIRISGILADLAQERAAAEGEEAPSDPNKEADDHAGG